MFSLNYQIVDELQSLTEAIISPCMTVLCCYNFYINEDHLHVSTPGNCITDTGCTPTHLLTMHLMMSWCLCWASSTFLYFSAEFFPFFLSFVKRLVAHLTVGMMLNGGGNVEPSKYDIHNLVLANFHSLKCQYNHVMDVFWLTSTFSLDEMFYFSFMV